jgi:hypothetical protein
MNRTLSALFAAGALAGSLAIALPATAQSWLPINARQTVLDARIDQGVRSRALTANEAVSLRAQFRDIANLESRYRGTGGLQEWERKDLDARFDRLSASIRVQANDSQRAGVNSGWQPISTREAMLNDRINQGIRERTITSAEAGQLRGDYRTIARLEDRYRANGLQDWERNDLQERFERLVNQIRIEKADNQVRRGVGSNGGYNRR